MTPGTPLTGDNFNEPQTDDNTSAPPQPQIPANSPLQKLRKPSKARNPGALAGAIARAKRAKQPSYKYGN